MTVREIGITNIDHLRVGDLYRLKGNPSVYSVLNEDRNRNIGTVGGGDEFLLLEIHKDSDIESVYVMRILMVTEKRFTIGLLCMSEQVFGFLGRWFRLTK